MEFVSQIRTFCVKNIFRCFTCSFSVAWSTDLTSLCVSILVYKMVPGRVPIMELWWFNNLKWRKYLVKYLAHRWYSEELEASLITSCGYSSFILLPAFRLFDSEVVVLWLFTSSCSHLSSTDSMTEGNSCDPLILILFWVKLFKDTECCLISQQCLYPLPQSSVTILRAGTCF